MFGNRHKLKISGMARIHPLASIDPAARIADDAEIGPFCVVGPHVSIASGCRLVSHVRVAGHTSIGARTVVHPYASLGGPPQSLSYRGEPTRLVIGADCDLREGVTMNLGTQAGGGVTEVGDHGLYMAYAHVGHDCRVGDHVIFANCATLGGHCSIGDYVFFGGLSAVLQHTRIGNYAMIGGICGVRADVIPFGLANGAVARLMGINVVGMRRGEFSSQSTAAARKAYRMLFLDNAPMTERISKVASEFGSDSAVAQILAFIRAGRNRPLCRPGRQVDD
jgi:UDP-N-acetylglucosamine acyltransferase